MRANGWQEVTRRSPCPACGKSSWCGINLIAGLGACRRINPGAGKHRVDRAGGEYWLYRLAVGASLADIPAEPRPSYEPQRLDPEVVHQVYSGFLGLLSLNPQHRANLHRRGLADHDILRRRYRSLPRFGRAELAGRLVDRFGAELCRHIPGLHRVEHEKRSWWSIAGPPGLLIPVRDLDRHIIALLVRRDDADADPRYVMVSSRKYDGPSPGSHVHLPLFEGGSRAHVRLTEGPLKADIATALSGVLTLGLPGVGSWRRSLSLLSSLGTRTVSLAFDTDADHKWPVARALGQTARALHGSGFTVRLERWGEADGKGIDDVLAAGHTPNQLDGPAMWDAIRVIMRRAAALDPTRWRQRLLTRTRYTRQRLHLPSIDLWLGRGGWSDGLTKW
jgi:DNA primase